MAVGACTHPHMGRSYLGIGKLWGAAVRSWWLSAALFMLNMRMHVAGGSKEGAFLGGREWSELAAMARIRCIDIAYCVAHMQLGVQLKARGASAQRSCTLNSTC
jgi:hypothetical protein